MRARLLFRSSLALVCSAFALTAQVPENLPPEVAAKLAEMQAAAAGPSGPTVTPAGGAKKADEEALDDATKKKIAAFKKLVFDRRPSTILKTWALPELKPYDPKEEEKKNKDKEGAGAKAGPNEKQASAGAVPGQPGPGRPAAVSVLLGPGSSGPAVVTGVPLTPAASPAAPTTQPSTSSSSAMSASQIQKLINKEAGEAPKQPEAAAPAAPAVDPKKAAEEAALAAKKLKREMEMLQRDVTLGRWEKVAEFLASLPEKPRKECYEHLLKKLPTHPNKPRSNLPLNLQERNKFSFDEALLLAGMAPGGFDKKQAAMLAPIIKRALDDGNVPEELIRLFEIELSKPAEAQRVDRREVALVLASLKMEEELGAFLPTSSQAEANDDREALNLLARHALRMYAKEQKKTWLEEAWTVTQAALAKGDIEKEQKEEALRRAVDLAPKVREDLGPAWLEASFTARPERGMEIIATIGGQVATGFQKKGTNTSFRATGLELQKTAVEALLKVAPKLADKWRPTLTLLASSWIQEAAHTQKYSQTNSYGTYMRRDSYGNIYWSSSRMGGGGRVKAIEPEDVLDSQPGPKWASLLSEEVKPHFTTVSAQLWLKVNEYEQAFPYIEELASSNPRKAKELADEFLRVWKRNNNPNTNNRTNSYMFIYGFEQRANGIPLTRSKQERNLKELADYVAKLRDLDGVSVDPQLLSDAFIAAHSTAEVYRMEAINMVFGDIRELDPVVLGTLLGTMRTNLAGVWRVPAVQERAKTKRSNKEMDEMVARGYETAMEIADSAVAATGRHWALLVAKATLLHDKNNFDKEKSRSSNFSDVRKEAFGIFAEACEHYSSICEGLALNEETDVPFTQWFYSALGAADLGSIDESMVVAKGQLPLIKEALAELPDESRERHEGRFANLLFTRMSAVKPQIKFRYLQHGFEICGEHEQAREAKKVWQYYQDLLHELKLETVVDGSGDVGTQPFGVRIDIVHSREIAKESGGFQKYATNQNNMQFAWNYGRPTENYRDKFHDAAIASLQENFEILSVTFNSEKMEAMLHEDPRWQRTPYAYLLLKARGPQVDSIPEIKLDLDFNDTSGFTILPIGSSPVAIDASAEPAERPFANIEVSQLLDEREVDEGRVTLEVKAKCKGLVPDLESFLTLETPGFKIKKRGDEGSAVTRFSDDQTSVESERVWMLVMEPESESATPGQFRFAEPKDDDITAIYQRYNDADLETVTAEIALRRTLIANNPAWAWVLLAIGAIGYIIWFFFGGSGGPAPTDEEESLRMPEQLTPFSVLALLHQIRARTTLASSQQEQLEQDMRRIEQSHFSREVDESLELDKIAGHWLSKAS